MRYHKDVFFPEEHHQRLNELVEKFNSKKRFGRTDHAVDRLKERFDYIGILNFLANNIKFRFENIFEYYVNENKKIVKICFKLHYDAVRDLIIILTANKDIVTLYVNNKGDNHKTLKKELYSVA